MVQINKKLLQDPNIDYDIYSPSLPFHDYIKKCRNIIENNRQDLHNKKEIIIAANSPFELVPEKKAKTGVLLIHGLLDCPFLTRDMGNYFQAQGVLARSILLPGHGTVPGALLNVRYQDWIKTVKYGVNSFAGEVEQLFLVGFSTGATLAVLEAYENPAIAGIGLLSPAFKINSPIDFVAGWYKSVSWAWERAKWFCVTEEIDYTRYSSITFNAIDQVYQLGKKVKKISQTQQLLSPMFLVMTADDAVICSKAALEFFQKNASTDSRGILYTNKINDSVDTRIQIRNSSYPKLFIKNFSHIALPSSQNNFHYGTHGDFINASHIEENLELYKQLQYGEVTKLQQYINKMLLHLHLTKQQKQRLTFNPDFEFMMAEITAKFQRCCHASESWHPAQH